MAVFRVLRHLPMLSLKCDSASTNDEWRANVQTLEAARIAAPAHVDSTKDAVYTMCPLEEFPRKQITNPAILKWCKSEFTNL
jgi:hypothetical protein